MATMEVILATKIEGLGAEADLVTVKAGYGRNYLIPRVWPTKQRLPTAVSSPIFRPLAPSAKRKNSAPLRKWPPRSAD
ncbi:MAG: hypothetical protein ACLT8C_02445 [Akkermansia muciniphila]